MMLGMLKSNAFAAADCADDLTGEPFHTHLAVLTTDLEVSGVSSLGGNAASWIGLTDGGPALPAAGAQAR